MNSDDKTLIMENAKKWFRETIAANHIRNTVKLENPSEFNINPFLAVYLANFLTGNSDSMSIAKALVYPRVLGTSITTSFGQNIQSFTSQVLGSFGSTTSGIDIEFTDLIDNRKKYCQLKAGPNTINKDDVETIVGHFRSANRLARTNGLKISHEDFIVGVIYGESRDLSSHYNRIHSDYNYNIIVGSDFWTRLTGDKNFYIELIEAIGEVAVESDFSVELERTITALSGKPEIKNISDH